MTDTSVSDAYVFPQDEGTGVPADSSDVASAASFGLLAGHVDDASGGYVGNGLTFSDVDTANQAVDITPGHAFIPDRAAEVQSGSQMDYDITLPDGSDAVYAVVLPSLVDNLALDAGVNDVWLAVDPSTNDGVYLRHGSGLSAPSDPNVHLGAVDVDTGQVTRESDGPVTHDRQQNNTYYVGTGSYPTIQAAHDAAGIGGHIVITPRYDEFDESFPVTISKEVTVEGAGALFIDNPTSNDTFHVDHGGHNLYPGAKFINVNINGGGHGFNQRDARYVTYMNCRVNRADGDGFRIGQDGTTGAITNYFANCVSRRCTGRGFNFGEKTHANTMFNCTAEKNSREGVDTDYATASTFIGCVFQLNDSYGIRATKQEGGGLYGCYFEGNSADVTADVMLEQTKSFTIDTCYFQGFNDNERAIVTVSGRPGRNCSIRSCSFRNYTSEAIRLNGGDDYDVYRHTHTLNDVPSFMADGGLRTRSAGEIVPQDLSGVTGLFHGDRAVDDGSNTSSGHPENAIWDSSAGVWYTQSGDEI